ncbi:hypothetical protein LLEC1_07806 [Akanthomyces lecanii]|uniref:Uncharacterized protein n=1 Tax=Cordyceps confragosa TaxID=2714763 RepID=A0A179ICC4_CORDF|nr:hypothetical protein LLEC1_07806 [Akanthomyces lecanii]
MSDHSNDNGVVKDSDYAEGHKETLSRFLSAQSIAMTPELSEKLYLSPQNRVKGDLRKTFTNPTPIAIAGFILCPTPLACDLMGWRGAGGNGAVSIPVYYFQGGILMTLGAILEWILGNTSPAIVFGTFGSRLPAPSTRPFPPFRRMRPRASPGLPVWRRKHSTPASLLFIGFLCFVYLICSGRTNIVFFLIFLSLVLAFSLLTGAYWALAKDYAGNAAHAHKLVVSNSSGPMDFTPTAQNWVA